MRVVQGRVTWQGICGLTQIVLLTRCHQVWYQQLSGPAIPEAILRTHPQTVSTNGCSQQLEQHVQT